LSVATSGVIAGLIAAFAGERLIGSLLYGVSAHDPIVLGTVSVTMLIVSLLASIAPALQALAVDPLVALRVE
jgi:ABC-type lipoprotein release transport system permease subunit